MTALERLRERRARHRRRSLWIRASVALAGFAVLAGGLAFLVLPGPGLPLVVAGLGLLALEFRWAEAALDRAVRHTRRVRPRKRSHRIALTGAALAATAASTAFVVGWGLF